MSEHQEQAQAAGKSGLLSAIAGFAVLAVAGAGVAYGLWLASVPTIAPWQGQADGRVVEVSAKIPGRIGEVLVEEGEMVKKGQVLVKVEIPEISAKLGQVEALRSAAQAKARLAEEGARREQIAALKAQMERAQAGATLARKTYARVSGLYKEGLISAQKHDEARAQLDSATRLVAAAKSQHEMAVAGLRADEIAAAKALAQQAEQGVAEVKSLAAEADVRAPRDGEVTRVVLQSGEVAPAGFSLVTLLDHSDMWATFNVREDEMQGLAVGSIYRADVPALAAKGKEFLVYWVSPRADYAVWRATRQSSGYDIRTFEVRMRPLDDLPGLRPGMSVIIPR
ncbi:MAG: HlyD family secretion protein [Duodenibacillus sp.]|nr:HlyD family secretion protein [Duodenibacillus sp.]